MCVTHLEFNMIDKRCVVPQRRSYQILFLTDSRNNKWLTRIWPNRHEIKQGKKYLKMQGF